MDVADIKVDISSNQDSNAISGQVDKAKDSNKPVEEDKMDIIWR